MLEVKPISPSDLLIGAYADCVWKAHVDFGDGSSEDYVFDASVGITGSHVFPTPGTTYTVVINLREGHHGQSKDPCPDYSQSVKVLFRTPEEEADDPAPWVPIDQGGTQPDLLPVAPDAVIPNAFEQTVPPSPEPTSYWRRCRGAVFAHLVSCRKGLRVAKAARARLIAPGTVQTNGFACRLRRSLQSIVCRRGEQSVRAPGPARDRR